jgi:hypothetical protein
VARRRPTPRSHHPLERWQTVLAAVVAALGAVTAAVIAVAAGSGDDGRESATASPSASASVQERGTVTIVGIDLLSADPARTVMRLYGTASGVRLAEHIYVVARPEAGGAPSRTPTATTSSDHSVWLAAGPADRPTEDSWTVDFAVPADASRPLRFEAVVPRISCWPPEHACAEPPGPEAVRRILEEEGPVGGIRSSETVVP